MGAAASTNSHSPVGTIQQQSEELLKLFIYYKPNSVVDNEDLEIAKETWKIVIEDRSLQYIKLKSSEPPLEASSCLSWFYDVFYEFSGQMDTGSQQLYKDNLKIQIRALIAMISSTLSMFTGLDLTKVNTSLTKLATGHYKRGVRSYQYAIVGVILLKTFEFCLGDSWNEKCHLAWAKMFSVMLEILLPAALKVEEKEDNESQRSTSRSEADTRKSTSIPIQLGKDVKLPDTITEIETPETSEAPKPLFTVDMTPVVLKDQLMKVVENEGEESKIQVHNAVADYLTTDGAKDIANIAEKTSELTRIPSIRKKQHELQ
eukprot:gene17017-22523_t